MLTPDSERALANLRDASHLHWYVVPLLAIAIYVYAVEIERRNWSLVFAGLALWAMDWLNEIANGLILHFTNRSALWTTPDQSAYVILVGLNIEICFMFAIAGVALGKTLPADRSLRILGLPNRIFLALTYSIFCVFIEVFLNRAGILLWHYSFWNWPQVWLIIPFGYLHFFLVAFWVHDMDSVARKIRVVGGLYGVVIAALIGFGGVLGWI